MLLKLLPTLTEHRLKYPFVIGVYGTSFWSSAVGIWVLKIKVVESSAIDSQHLKTLVIQNPRQSVVKMSQIMGVNISTISDHLKKIVKVKKLSKWVPHESSESQRIQCFEVYLMLHLWNPNDPFLDQIMTSDEEWILYDIHKWLAWSWWRTPKLHQQKIMVTGDPPLTLSITVFWNLTRAFHPTTGWNALSV